MRLLDGLRVAHGVGELHEASLHGGPLVGQQADDRFEPFVERVEAVGEGRVDVDAVGVGLFLVPPRAEAELEAAVAHDVERRGHVGEHRGMAVRHAGDEHADAAAGAWPGRARW